MTKFIKARPKDLIGSSFNGFLLMPYEHLEKCLGKPNDRTKDNEWRSGDNKVRAEWSFKTKHKKPTMITIYDYKEIIPVENVTMWHVGLKGDESRFIDFFIEKNLGYPQKP